MHGPGPYPGGSAGRLTGNASISAHRSRATTAERTGSRSSSWRTRCAAEDPTDGPLARVRVPLGLRGNWLPTQE
ncbi:hypothetical protein GTW40_32150 [Streptomyces sp. SID4985]|nr:hypothetical protein [Streptomyces sp. SID4985]